MSARTALGTGEAVGRLAAAASRAGLTVLGDFYNEVGDVDAARTAWRRVVEIYERVGHSGAERVRAKLNVGPAVGRR
jgi:hypothetical protein